MIEAIEARAGPAGRVGLAVLGLLLLAAAATGGAVYVIAVSRIAPSPVAQSLLSALVCLTFVGAGVAALRVRPYGRFGLLLAAVGFASLVSVLHESNHAAPYTAGVFASNLVYAVLVHALLAYPSGRLGPIARRVLVAAYLDVIVLQALAVLFDPLTRYHSAHPANLALVDSQPALATGLYELEAAIAAGISLVAVFVLTSRARAATPATRRQHLPVVVGGSIALLLFSLGLVLAPLSSRAGFVGFGLALVAALALPAAFLATLVGGRLSQAAVGELLRELRDPAQPAGLEEALRRALGDPTLRLGRPAPDGGYLDGAGAALVLPERDAIRVATPILHQGEPVGILVHDRSLRLRAELLEAVNAAAGFALANERALHKAGRAEQRNRALLDAIPDTILRYARDGTYLDVRPDALTAEIFPPDDFLGRNSFDVLPYELARTITAGIERALDTGSIQVIEYEVTVQGVAHWREARIVPSGADEVVSIVRDFTEKRRADAELRRLAEEQAALRRVATLVASDAAPERVFQLVTEEVCRLLGIPSALLERFESPTASRIVARYGGEALPGFEVGTEIRLEEGLAVLRVLRTGAPARVDCYDGVPGRAAELMRELGFRSTVAVPITVAGATWGALAMQIREGETLPPETERRLQAFAELVALAVASAQARDELAASRLRIVEASDAERRRLERNLHDGAQQRLVALSVALRIAQAKVAESPGEAVELLAVAADELAEALVELRELAQGLHPAVLTDRGLAEALDVLAARVPLPVELEVALPERLPEQVEVAAYYVVSEGLANVVKHARADSARVWVARENGHVTVAVEDDGVGGAALDAGSGLCGLRDRVETLDGRLRIASGPGSGTLLRAELPLHARVGVGAGEER